MDGASGLPEETSLAVGQHRRCFANDRKGDLLRCLAADVESGLAGLESWLAGTSDDLSGWPGYDALAPARDRRARHPAILLPFRSLLAALKAAG